MPAPVAPPAVPEATKAEAPKTGSPAPETKPAEKDAKADKTKWTVQLVATTDQGEAKRIAARATSAGFVARITEDKGTFKVRLSKQGTKEATDAMAERLKARGFKAFPVKAE